MSSTTNADLIITGARVHTMGVADSGAKAPAEAIAIQNGRIAAVGAKDEIVATFQTSRTEMHDLAGRTVTPGLIDAHLHPIQGVELTQGIDLAGVITLAGLRERLGAEARRLRETAGEGWLRGWNLDYSAFEGQPLTASLIDECLAGVPTLLFFFDFHTAVANTAALQRAGITGARNFTDSAEIVVDHAGRPTGELREESAYAPITSIMPLPSPEETADAARAIFRRMRRSGLTGGTIMDGNSGTLDLLETIDRSGSGLPVRIASAVDLKPIYSAEQRLEILAQRDRRGARWRGGMIKLYADGVVETGSAWLYEPDSDGIETEGFWENQDEFVAVLELCTAAGFQVATHAIGDRAVGETITAYEAVGLGAQGQPRHRIEHLETLDPRDIARLAAHGIAASMQMPHMQWRLEDQSDEWSRKLGPLRTSRAWNAGSVLRAGAPLALGSDWPIATLDAREGLAWAVLRRRAGDAEGFVYEPGERLTNLEALHGYTRGAALAQGDHDLGVIRQGAIADLAVWEEDPAEVTGDDLAQLPVHSTYLDGERLLTSDID